MSTQVSAKWVDGYYITHNNEEIKGKVLLRRYSPRSGGLNFAGVDFERMYTWVQFKTAEGKKVFEPNEIKEFGFVYKGSSYLFVSAQLPFKSIVKSERIKERFLNVVYKGSLCLMRDDVELCEDIAAVKGGEINEIVTYSEYYLWSSDKGFTKVEKRGGIKSLKELLVNYGMDSEFLQNVPDNITNRDFVDILSKYDRWLDKRLPTNISKV